MFGRFKKKTTPEEPKTTEEPKVTEKPEPEATKKPEVTQQPEVTKKSETTDKPEAEEKSTKKTKKTAKTSKETPSPHVPADAKGKKPFIGISEYSSVSEISESIEKELAETKSALGGYLRQLDDRRAVAEKTQRIYNVVAKVADKMPSKTNPNSVDLGSLEVVVDATVLNELTAIENVVQSHQKRLIALQKAREALKTLDQAGDTEGIKYLAIEKDGIPEQILLKLA